MPEIMKYSWGTAKAWRRILWPSIAPYSRTVKKLGRGITYRQSTEPESGCWGSSGFSLKETTSPLSGQLQEECYLRGICRDTQHRQVDIAVYVWAAESPAGSASLRGPNPINKITTPIRPFRRRMNDLSSWCDTRLFSRFHQGSSHDNKASSIQAWAHSAPSWESSWLIWPLASTKGKGRDGPACNPGMFLLSSSGVLANLNLHQNLLKDLLTEVGGPQSASVGLGRGLRTCISHKLWGDVDAACATHLENC